MKKINELMQEIVRITTDIETNYPELYRYLDETPISLDNSTKTGVTTKDLESYLNTLKEQLNEHITLHKQMK